MSLDANDKQNVHNKCGTLKNYDLLFVKIISSVINKYYFTGFAVIIRFKR